MLIDQTSMEPEIAPRMNMEGTVQGQYMKLLQWGRKLSPRILSFHILE